MSCNKSDKTKEILPSQSFLLSDEEVSKLEKEALKGSSDAAFKLSDHYSVVDKISKRSLYWLTIAAKNGHNLAPYTLAILYFYNSEIKNISEAKYWAKKAALRGDKDAIELLKEIENTEKKK